MKVVSRFSKKTYFDGKNPFKYFRLGNLLVCYSVFPVYFNMDFCGRDGGGKELEVLRQAKKNTANCERSCMCTLRLFEHRLSLSGGTLQETGRGGLQIS